MEIQVAHPPNATPRLMKVLNFLKGGGIAGLGPLDFRDGFLVPSLCEFLVLRNAIEGKDAHLPETILMQNSG